LKKIRLYNTGFYQFLIVIILLSSILLGSKFNDLFTWRKLNGKGGIENPQFFKQNTWIKSNVNLPTENRPVISEYHNLFITHNHLRPLSNKFKEKMLFESNFLSMPSRVDFPRFSFKDIHTENIRYLDKAHGLFSNSIMSVCEDEKGYMWIASETEGLVKTNGTYSWDFKKKHGLKSNAIIRLFKDSKNRMWICWEKGVSYLFGNKLYNVKNKTLNQSKLSRIREDEQGNIWLGTEENGLFKMTGAYLELYNVERGLSSNNISDIAFDNSGLIYITCVDRGLNILHKERSDIKIIKDKDSIAFEFSPISLLKVKDKLWIGSFAGAQFYWKDNKMYKVKFKKGFERCFEIVENEYGIWFADYSSGMQLLKKDGSIHSFEKAHGLVNRNAFSFVIDRNKNVWVADPFYGLSVISISPFRAKKELGHYILRMIKTSTGDILGAHNGLGISRIKNNELQLINIKQGKGIYTVDHSWDIEEDIDGSFWVSTHGMGIAKLNEENFNLYFFEKGQLITDITKGENNDFWFSTGEHGIRQWSSKEKKFRLFTTNDGLSSNNVRASMLDHSNRLWICTDKGIDVKWGDKIAHINKKKGLASDDINNVIEDNKGRYWVSTNDAGVNLITQNGILQFDQSTGLINDRVLSIYNSSEKVTWVITTSGLTRLTETSPLKFKKENFGVNYGGFMLDFTGGTFKKADGKILFFTSQGCVEFDPYFLMSEKPTINWNIEKILVDNVTSKSSSRLLSVLKNENLVIESSLLNWRYKENSEYFFAMLEKHSNDTIWVQTKINERIRPETKQIGEYQLLYQVNTNGEQVIFSGPIFKIVNPWYQTVWFYAICSVIFVLSIYFLFRWRLKNIRKKKGQLEEIVKQRTVELEIEKNELALAYEAIENQSKEKDVIIYEIHHRVKNNLQTITTLLDMQVRRISNQESVSVLQDTIRRISAMSTSHNLLYASDDFSRINLNKFLHELISSHEIFMFDNSSRIRIEYQIEDVAITMTDCISLGMIVSEVISNSMKHAFEGVESPGIKITAKHIDDYCILTISDNGIGIADKFLMENTGGLGLRLIRIFTTKLKGQIEIERMDLGTQVTVNFMCK
jgi:two-component sensor histidine kinase/ligand-binding sensor domain-containing protein